MFTVSGEQFARATAYINQYNQANLNLTLVAGRVQANFMGVIDLTPFQKFLSDIQSTLSENVQQLTVKFSPANVQSYILGYYQTFLTNLILNNGTASEISAMNLVYYGKILSPNASDCYARYNNLYSDIYSKAAANFSQTMESEVASTVTRLETLRKEIETLITNLVNNFEQIIDDKATAFAAIGSFVRNNCSTRIWQRYKFPFQIATNSLTLGSTVTNWVTEFSALMKQTQQNIKDGFIRYDSARVNDTLIIVQQALDCLQAA